MSENILPACHRVRVYVRLFSYSQLSARQPRSFKIITLLLRFKTFFLSFWARRQAQRGVIISNELSQLLAWTMTNCLNPAHIL